jgi:hypothetical protein
MTRLRRGEFFSIRPSADDLAGNQPAAGAGRRAPLFAAASAPVPRQRLRGLDLRDRLAAIAPTRHRLVRRFPRVVARHFYGRHVPGQSGPGADYSPTLPPFARLCPAGVGPGLPGRDGPVRRARPGSPLRSTCGPGLDRTALARSRRVGLFAPAHFPDGRHPARRFRDGSKPLRKACPGSVCSTAATPPAPCSDACWPDFICCGRMTWPSRLVSPPPLTPQWRCPPWFSPCSRRIALRLRRNEPPRRWPPPEQNGSVLPSRCPDCARSPAEVIWTRLLSLMLGAYGLCVFHHPGGVSGRAWPRQHGRVLFGPRERESAHGAGLVPGLAGGGHGVGRRHAGRFPAQLAGQSQPGGQSLVHLPTRFGSLFVGIAARHHSLGRQFSAGPGGGRGARIGSRAVGGQGLRRQHRWRDSGRAGRQPASDRLDRHAKHPAPPHRPLRRLRPYSALYPLSGASRPGQLPAHPPAPRPSSPAALWRWRSAWPFFS